MQELPTFMQGETNTEDRLKIDKKLLEGNNLLLSHPKEDDSYVESNKSYMSKQERELLLNSLDMSANAEPNIFSQALDDVHSYAKGLVKGVANSAIHFAFGFLPGEAAAYNVIDKVVDLKNGDFNPADLYRQSPSTNLKEKIDAKDTFSKVKQSEDKLILPSPSFSTSQPDKAAEAIGNFTGETEFSIYKAFTFLKAFNRYVPGMSTLSTPGKSKILNTVKEIVRDGAGFLGLDIMDSFSSAKGGYGEKTDKALEETFTKRNLASTAVVASTFGAARKVKTRYLPLAPALFYGAGKIAGYDNKQNLLNTFTLSAFLANGLVEENKYLIRNKNNVRRLFDTIYPGFKNNANSNVQELREKFTKAIVTLSGRSEGETLDSYYDRILQDKKLIPQLVEVGKTGYGVDLSEGDIHEIVSDMKKGRDSWQNLMTEDNDLEPKVRGEESVGEKDRPEEEILSSPSESTLPEPTLLEKQSLAKIKKLSMYKDETDNFTLRVAANMQIIRDVETDIRKIKALRKVRDSKEIQAVFEDKNKKIKNLDNLIGISVDSIIKLRGLQDMLAEARDNAVKLAEHRDYDSVDLLYSTQILRKSISRQIAMEKRSWKSYLEKAGQISPIFQRFFGEESDVAQQALGKVYLAAMRATGRSSVGKKKYFTSLGLGSSAGTKAEEFVWIVDSLKPAQRQKFFDELDSKVTYPLMQKNFASLKDIRKIIKDDFATVVSKYKDLASQNAFKYSSKESTKMLETAKKQLDMNQEVIAESKKYLHRNILEIARQMIFSRDANMQKQLFKAWYKDGNMAARNALNRLNLHKGINGYIEKLTTTYTKTLNGLSPEELDNLNLLTQLKSELYRVRRFRVGGNGLDIDGKDIGTDQQVDIALNLKPELNPLEYIKENDFETILRLQNNKKALLSQVKELKERIGSDQFEKIDKVSDTFGRDLHMHLLSLLRDSGIISARDAERMSKIEFYAGSMVQVSILNSMKQVGIGSGVSARVNKPEEMRGAGISGSLKEVDARQIIYNEIQTVVTAASKNKLYQSLVDFAEQRPKDIDEKFIYTPEQKEKLVSSGLRHDISFVRFTYYEDGQKQYFYTDTKMAGEIAGVNPLGGYTAKMALSFISMGSGTTLTKTLATVLNVGFAATNLGKDIVGAIINKPAYSANLALATTQFLSDFRTVTKNIDLFADSYIENGGGMSFFAQLASDRPGILLKKSTKVGKVWGSICDVLTYPGTKTELWTRLAVMHRYLKHQGYEINYSVPPETKLIDRLKHPADDSYMERIKDLATRLQTKEETKNLLKEAEKEKRRVKKNGEVKDNPRELHNKLQQYTDRKLSPEELAVIEREKKAFYMQQAERIIKEQDLAYAVAEGRSTIDFGQRGLITDVLDSMIPFFAAGTAGVKATWEAYQKNPKVFTFKILQFGAAVTLLQVMKNQDKLLKQQLPEYVEDRYHIFPLWTSSIDSRNNTVAHYLKFPKEPNFNAFSAFFEELGNFITGDKVKLGRIADAGASSLNVMQSSSTSPLLTAILAYSTNRLHGEDIWKGPENTKASEQKVSYDSMWNFVSRVGFSPVRFKAAIGQMFPPSNFITYPLTRNIMDVWEQKEGSFNKLAKSPFFRRFLGIGVPNMSQNDAIQQAKEIEDTKRTVAQRIENLSLQAAREYNLPLNAVIQGVLNNKRWKESVNTTAVQDRIINLSKEYFMKDADNKTFMNKLQSVNDREVQGIIAAQFIKELPKDQRKQQYLMFLKNPRYKNPEFINALIEELKKKDSYSWKDLSKKIINSGNKKLFHSKP